MIFKKTKGAAFKELTPHCLLLKHKSLQKPTATVVTNNVFRPVIVWIII